MSEFLRLTPVQFEEGVCFQNRSAGPGGCKYPIPAVMPELAGTLRLFNRGRNCAVFAGMSGVVVSPLWSEIAALAEALAEPWDELTIDRYGDLFDAWRDSLPKG